LAVLPGLRPKRPQHQQQRHQQNIQGSEKIAKAVDISSQVTLDLA
jgi:hypothetical protein